MYLLSFITPFSRQLIVEKMDSNQNHCVILPRLQGKFITNLY